MHLCPYYCALYYRDFSMVLMSPGWCSSCSTQSQPFLCLLPHQILPSFWEFSLTPSPTPVAEFWACNSIIQVAHLSQFAIVLPRSSAVVSMVSGWLAVWEWQSPPLRGLHASFAASCLDHSCLELACLCGLPDLALRPPYDTDLSRDPLFRYAGLLAWLWSCGPCGWIRVGAYWGVFCVHDDI